MNRQILTEEEMTYTVALDDDPALGKRVWAIVQAHLVDELTGTSVTTTTKIAPYGTAFRTPSARAAVTAQVGSGGVVGLVGIPTAALPQLNSQVYDVGIMVRADGYVPVSVTKSLGPDGTFPTTFTAADLGDLGLHRNPVVLRGRTVQRLSTGETVALPNATVRVTGMWRTIPPASAVVPPLAPQLAALTQPMYANRVAAGATVQSVSVTPVAGEDKSLLAASVVGDVTVRLSNHVNLVAGDTVVIDDADAGLREVMTIASMIGPSSPVQPVTATLAFPLAVAHAQGGVVWKATVTPLGPSDAISTDAVAGDVTVLLASVATLGAAGFVAITGGGPATAEYHWLSPYAVTSDPDGYYRMPPLSRVAQVTLEGEKAPYTPVPQTLSPNYAVREQLVDLVVT